MKTVSVIIPFYSRIDWLYEAVESVLSQTYPIHEIILVNDGSNEDVTGFLEKYGNRIVYIYQKNSGPAAARNNGIRHATGDYIAFEDSDDIWLPTKLEKQIAFMESIGAMWCHCGFYYWWPNSNKLKSVNVSRDYGDVYLQRHISTKIATPGVVLDRSIYCEGNYFFPEGVRNGEDDMLYTKLSEKYLLALVEEPLLKVRMRGTNSQNHAIERFHLRSQNYQRWKSENQSLTTMTHVIYWFYSLYSKVFRLNSNKFEDFAAKCCWTIPYVLERLYVRYIFSHMLKDEKFIEHV